MANKAAAANLGRVANLGRYAKTKWFQDEKGVWYKPCSKCGVVKTEVEFLIRRGKGQKGFRPRRSQCILCERETNKESLSYEETRIKRNAKAREVFDPIIRRKHSKMEKAVQRKLRAYAREMGVYELLREQARKEIESEQNTQTGFGRDRQVAR